MNDKKSRSIRGGFFCIRILTTIIVKRILNINFDKGINEVKHLYLKFTLGLTLMSFASPILAKSSKKTTAFMSNVEGAVATAYRKRKELGNCVTPCTLPIAIKKLDLVDFSHPNYPDTYFVERNLEKIRKDAKGTEGPIEIYGRFGPSYSEAAIENDREMAERYASEYAAALAGGDAPAKVLKIRAPNRPFKQSRSGWCKLRFTVTKTG
ncbi:MAG: hypothetical protein ABJL73_14250, partial [Lentilitoribacter sp.]